MVICIKFSGLTLWEPGYDIFVLWNQPKTSSCQFPYQCYSSFTNCSRELFKGSNGSGSLLVCTWKKNFWLGFFVSYIISEVVFGLFWLMLRFGPRAQPLSLSISLKFSSETRLESRFFWAFDRLSSVSGSKVMIWNKQIN